MVIWVTFLLRVIYIYIFYINIFVFGGGLLSYWGVAFCGYMVGVIIFFVLGGLGFFRGYGIGGSWILWKKVIYIEY